MNINNIKVDGLVKEAKSIDKEFPANSNKAKNLDGQEDLLEPKSKVQKVVTGRVIERKKPLSKKVTELFLGEGNTLSGAVSNIVKDIMIPSAKSLISDVVSNGIEMLLFGTTGGKRNRTGGIFGGGNSGRTYTSYDNYSKGNNRNRNDRDRNDRDRDERSTATQTYNDVVMQTRGDAEEVLSNLADLIQDYGVASVADFYGFVGIPGRFTDNEYGWDDLRGVKPYRTRDGYILNLPKTIRMN